MKIEVKKVLLCILCAIVLSGCGNDEPEKLEEYQNSEEEIEESQNKYEHLTSIILKEEGASLRIWLPDSDSIHKEDNLASSKKSGIEVEAELLKSSEDVMHMLCEEKAAEKQNWINALASVQGISVSGDASSGIVMISYSINDGNGNIYPCAVIIKVENIEDDYFLRTTVTVDNTSANEDTEKVLSEVLDAFGIQISS